MKGEVRISVTDLVWHGVNRTDTIEGWAVMK